MGSQHVSSFRCCRPRIDGTGRKTAYRRAMAIVIHARNGCPRGDASNTPFVYWFGSDLNLGEPLLDLLTHGLIAAGTLVVLENPVAD